MTGQRPEQVTILTEVGLRAGDHGAPYAELLRQEAHTADGEHRGAAPRVLDPAVSVGIEDEVGAEPPQAPVTRGIERGRSAQGRRRENEQWPGIGTLNGKPVLTEVGGEERSDSVLGGIDALPSSVGAD